ncbi:hypothetical protein Goari_012435, partial [Gossypium aridum]|nr:hypothetical protein [Gossypium aridum]
MHLGIIFGQSQYLAHEGVINSLCDGGDARIESNDTVVQHRYDFIPSREPFLTLKLTTSSDYRPWFRHHDKSYLLDEARTKKRRTRRPRQPHINPRSGVHALMESSSALTQHEAPRVAPPPGQYGSYYSSVAFTNP